MYVYISMFRPLVLLLSLLSLLLSLLVVVVVVVVVVCVVLLGRRQGPDGATQEAK